MVKGRCLYRSHSEMEEGVTKYKFFLLHSRSDLLQETALLINKEWRRSLAARWAINRGFAMGVVLPVWPIATVANLHFEWQKTAYFGTCTFRQTCNLLILLAS